jgi:hypothetical protein
MQLNTSGAALHEVAGRRPAVFSGAGRECLVPDGQGEGRGHAQPMRRTAAAEKRTRYLPSVSAAMRPLRQGSVVERQRWLRRSGIGGRRSVAGAQRRLRCARTEGPRFACGDASPLVLLEVGLRDLEGLGAARRAALRLTCSTGYSLA